MRTQKSLNLMGYSATDVWYFGYGHKKAVQAGGKETLQIL